jgi:ATP-dependent Clp protease protease subunit
MMQMSKHSPHPIEVYVNSNGGDVSSGLGIADYFRYLTNKSFVIPTKVMGVAYSAGALISSAGTPGHRSAMPSSRFLIHQLRAAGVEGNMEDLESDIKNLEKLNDQITTLLVKATKQKKKRVVADLRQETYMSAEEALNYGLIDHIL